MLANSTEVWLDDRGRLSLIDADSGEVLRDLQAERLIDIGNSEATGVVGDAIAVVSYCGSIVSYDPGSGGVAEAEVRGGGDEQCGGRWSVSSIGIALADASATPNEPALGMVFDATNGVAVGSFAVPFDVKKVALDQAGGWVIGSNGEIWRLPALSVPPGEVFAACLEFPEGGSSRQFAVPGTVIPLGAVDVGGLSALEVFRDRMVGLVDGSLVVIDPTDGSSAIVGVPGLSLEGVSVAGEDLWLHHRGPQGESVLLRIGPDGCPRRQISTHLEVRKVLSTPHGLWLETADDVIEIDGMSGAGVLAFAEATSTWEPVSPAEFPPMTEFLSNAVAFLAVDDVIVLMELCGDAVGISTTRQEAGFLSAERCDLTDWIAGEWGFLGWVIAEDGSTRWVLYDAVLVEVASGSLPGADIVMAVAADRGAYLLAGDGRFFFLGA